MCDSPSTVVEMDSLIVVDTDFIFIETFFFDNRFDTVFALNISTSYSLLYSSPNILASSF